MKAFPFLSRLSLLDAQMITVCGDENKITSTDRLLEAVQQEIINTSRIDWLAVLLKGVPVIGEAACLDAEHCFDALDWQIELLLIRLLELDLSMEPDSGLIINCPFELSNKTLEALSLGNAKVVLQASSLEQSLDSWNEALAETFEGQSTPSNWYWLCVDSLCNHDWLKAHKKQLFSSQIQPEGLIAGEAAVWTHWQIDKEVDKTGSFGSLQEWKRSKGTEISSRLNVLSDKVPEKPIYIVTNDDLSKESLSTNYHLRKHWWPDYVPSDCTQPKTVSSFPFVSSYLALGDCGMANLPIALVLAVTLREKELNDVQAEINNMNSSNEPLQVESKAERLPTVVFFGCESHHYVVTLST